MPGEAVYRSPVVTAGYYHDEEATEEAFRDGWFHSGDVCVYDERRRCEIMVDRSKDIIKSGGENVSTLRVETILRQHPEVAQSRGRRPAPRALGRGGDRDRDPARRRRADAEEVIAFCRERLAGYESPKRVIVVDALPETVGGKVLKYKLREQLSAGSPSTR